jgi:TolA-binding protein
MTNSDSERSSPTVEPLKPDIDGEGATSSGPRSPRRRASPPQSRVEAQLRWRMAELEARVSELGRCLGAAEYRSSELVQTVEEAERRFEAIATSKSWRMTGFLRSGARRIRHPFRP